MNYPLRLLTSLILLSGALILAESCKKLDFTKYPAVNTLPTSGISTSVVTANGDVIDLGDNNMVNHGFCWSKFGNPVISDDKVNLGIAVSLGAFSSQISGLQPNTTYYLRAFVETDEQVFYGYEVSFKTKVTSGGNTWLHYDNGINEDGIGSTAGGSWDYAIRFPASDMAPYDGLRISQVKFYPYGYSSADYSITIWTGNTPDLEHVQTINNPIYEQFNTVALSANLYVDASKDLWVGIWVQDQPVGEYPGGVDAGPAVSGFGDLISFDGGDTWESLYVLNNSLNYNWNLQVYVQSGKDKDLEIKRSPDIGIRKPKTGKSINDIKPSGEIVSSSLTEASKIGGTQ